MMLRIVVCALLFWISNGAGQTLGGVPKAEFDALVALYNSTNGAAWTNTYGKWTGTAPCYPGATWFGLQCTGTGFDDHVQEVVLTNINLTGTLPSLSGLTYVVYFGVELNHLTGRLPSLAGLTNLLFFAAGNNQLTGQIPSLSGLNNMTDFDVSNNNLSGPMPVPPSPTNLVLPPRGVGASLCGNFLQSTGSVSADQAWDAFSGTKPINGVPGWLACQRAPTVAINAGGVVAIDSAATTIQPGSWASVFGTNLANTTVAWSGDFPTFLGGADVMVNGKSTYLSFVSPGQINLQAPDDPATGTVQVVVSTPNGAATSTVTLGRFGPSFLVQADGKHVVAIVQTPGSPGSSGAGYDIVGPSRPVASGETLVLYGVGFGPTSPNVPAGAPFTGAASTLPSDPVQIMIGGVAVAQYNVQFSGLVGAGLYQLNIVVPSGLGSGDQNIVATVGGLKTQSTVLLTLR